MAEKTDLPWVEGKLREFVERNEGTPENAALVLSALQTLGNLLVKEGKGKRAEAPPDFLNPPVHGTAGEP